VKRLRAYTQEQYRGARRRTAIYLIVALAWGFGMWRVEENYHADVERAQVEEAAEALRSCRDRQVGREALRQIAIVATSGGPIDFSQFESYDDLDPAMKRFLTEFGSAQGSDGSRRERLLESAPPILCPGDPGYVPPTTTTLKD
jgi:hypothetical protein